MRTIVLSLVDTVFKLFLVLMFLKRVLVNLLNFNNLCSRRVMFRRYMTTLLHEACSGSLASTCTPKMADGSVVVCATVSTGLESVAVKECKERLGCKSVREARGRIYFDIPANSFLKVKSLRSIENLFLVVKEFQENNCEGLDCYSPDILEKLYKLPQDLEWNLALSLWKEFTGYSGVLLKGDNPNNSGLNINVYTDDKTQAVDKNNKSSSQNEHNDESLADSVKEAPAKRMKHSNEGSSEGIPSKQDGAAKVASSQSATEALTSDKASEDATIATLPRFRVTCTRTGKNHSFSSPEAAAKFGGGINDWFGWRVDLSHADIEVLLNIVDNSVVIGIALTKESRGKRNIAHFGPTTLKSSIAYSMLSLADIQPGDIVCDPMCGGGSIPIEGTLNWTASVHLCGDHHDLAPPRTSANVQNVQLDAKKTLPLDIYQWDVCNLPLKSNSVDVFVSDLPFGKKSGSKHENWKLYPKALEELARVCRTGSGRAVLLTQDKRVMGQVLNRSAQWKKDVTLWINMGGLKAGVYVLTRTKQ